MASRHYKEELEKKMAKWTEMGERVRLLEGEKGELEKEKVRLEERVQELERGGSSKLRVR